MIDFIGLGAQKSGTSWVYTCLYEHPQICIPIKEIHFFSRPRFEQGRQWYESHFNTCGPAKLRGEFSTSYLYSPEASKRIHDMYPEAKLLAILRNPADRALSQYRNAIKAGEITEAVPFESYLQNEASVIGQGRYYEQLDRYLALFPKEQLQVLVYEDIKRDSKKFMQTIYEFLGVDSSFVSTMLNAEINIARTPRNVLVGRAMHRTAEFLRQIGMHKFVHMIRKMGLPDLIHTVNTKAGDPTIGIDRASLAKYFKDDVEKLSVLLGRDMGKEWNI